MAKTSPDKNDTESPGDRTLTELVRILIAVQSRIAFPKNELRRIVVGESRTPWRWVSAYNACDGTRTQAQIAAIASVDVGDLSRAVTRWINEGILFRLGADRLPFGLYPLPAEKPAPSTEPKSGSSTRSE